MLTKVTRAVKRIAPSVVGDISQPKYRAYKENTTQGSKDDAVTRILIVLSRQGNAQGLEYASLVGVKVVKGLRDNV